MTPPPAIPAASVGPPGPPRVDADGVRRVDAVRYRATPGFRPVELDLVLPPTGPAPLVLFVHGGGWRAGDRRAIGPQYDADAVFAGLARAGIAVASVDYRLSAEVVFPGPLDDVAAALAWVRRYADEMGVDRDRIAVWGESAGGHLAALLAFGAPPLLEAPAELRALVAWYTPSDLVALPGDAGTDPADPGSREALMLGAASGADEAVARRASPLTYVDASGPPVLLLHGTADRFVPVAQSDRLHAALLAAGVPSTYERLEGADHLWLGTPDLARHALARTTTFLAEALGVSDVPAEPRR